MELDRKIGEAGKEAEKVNYEELRAQMEDAMKQKEESQ